MDITGIGGFNGQGTLSIIAPAESNTGEYGEHQRFKHKNLCQQELEGNLVHIIAQQHSAEGPER